MNVAQTLRITLETWWMKMHLQTPPKSVKDNVRQCPPAGFGTLGKEIVISELLLVLEEKLHKLGIRTGQNIVAYVRQYM